MSFKLETPLENVRESMFSRESSYGGKISFFASEEYRLSNSVAYSLQNRAFLLFPNEDKKWHISGDSFFMLIESGEEGFKTRLEVALCEIVEAWDTIIRFKPASPEDFERACATYRRSEYSLADSLSEVAYKKQNIKMVKVIMETAFIKTEGSTFAIYPLERPRENVYRLPENAYFLTEAGEVSGQFAKVGDLVLETRKNRNEWFQIARVESIVHDYKANLYVLAKVEYVYPRDVRALEKLFPDLILKYGISGKERGKKGVLQDCKVRTEIAESKLGEYQIIKKVETEYTDFAIRRGPFQFAVRLRCPYRDVKEYYHASDLHSADDRLLRIESDVYYGAPIMVDGKGFEIIFYQFTDFFNCNGVPYGSFDFSFNIGLFTSLRIGGSVSTNSAERIFFSYLNTGLMVPITVTCEERLKWPICKQKR
ncbi:MAG: hypothetical protein LBT59_05240 [Clostridiales bacterium]|jgi:hypothetical protein|nr:hypothetical protein [Clostridiales bacterium]